ncbi:hypothetical protein [Acidocella sp.]|uniref:hypothetical protein n=1 Tax=Acidocella sp. TaxID=50710 RepID=UPI002602B73C|nr:hypothetical protein [Acidocella sp.]
MALTTRPARRTDHPILTAHLDRQHDFNDTRLIAPRACVSKWPVLQSRYQSRYQSKDQET